MSKVSDNEKTYFLNWVNSRLKTVGTSISNFAEFADGPKLISLLEVLSGQRCTTKLVTPKNEIFQLQNLQIAMDMAKKMVKNLYVNGRNFLFKAEAQDIKLILGFIFDLICHYQVDSIEAEGMKGKDGLLMWCQKTTAGHQGVLIQNFSKSWIDGLGFLALAHAYNQNCVNYDEIIAQFNEQTKQGPDALIQGSKDRISKSLLLIQEQMGVEQIIDAEFATNPSDKACITYLSMIFKAFSHTKKSNKSLTLIQRMIKRASTIEQQERDLIQKIKDLQAKLKEADSIIKYQNSHDPQALILELNKIQDMDRKNQNEFVLQVYTIEDLLQSINQSRSGYGLKTLILKDEDKVEKLQSDITTVHQKCVDLMQKIKDQIKNESQQKADKRLKHLQELFTKFCAADPEHKYLQQHELEQLLMACDQSLDEMLMKNLYSDGKKVDFPQFCDIIDTLENDKDTNESLILAFNQLCGNQNVTEKQLQDAKLTSDEVAWLISHMPEYNENAKANDKLTGFSKQLTSSAKVNVQQGEKVYDFMGLIQKIFE